MIPLVSTLCKGPLGVAQLPRLWWKNLLHQAGQLDPAYPCCSGGLDKYVLEVLRLDQDSTLHVPVGTAPFLPAVRGSGQLPKGAGIPPESSAGTRPWRSAPTISRRRSTRPTAT